MIHSSPATLLDIYGMTLQAEQVLTVEDVTIETKELIKESWSSVTIRNNNEVLAIVGIVERHWRVASAWALVNAKLHGCGFPLTREVRALIDNAQIMCELRRLDMFVLADCRRHVVWAKRLGFHSEGRMEKMGRNGEDFLMMARVWE